ncbi:fimbrial protein [Xanthomonas sp. 60]
MTLCRTCAAAVLIMTVAIPVAHADQATLTLSGRVLPGTCVLTAPATALPDIKANDLTDGSSKLQTVTLRMDACAGVSRASLDFDGTEEPGNQDVWKNTAASGAATGVAFAILDGTSGTTFVRKGSTLRVTVSGASATKAIRVGYFKAAGAGVKAGALRAEITITATYQ